MCFSSDVGVRESVPPQSDGPRPDPPVQLRRIPHTLFRPRVPLLWSVFEASLQCLLRILCPAHWAKTGEICQNPNENNSLKI